MSFGLAELCLQEGLHQVPCHSRAHCPATHADNIHVIVLHPLTGGEMIVDQCGADAGSLVCTDRCSNAAAADGHAALDLPCRDSPGERSDIVRIVVVEAQALRTKIDNLMASRPELDDQFLLQAISAVISGATVSRRPGFGSTS